MVVAKKAGVKAEPAKKVPAKAPVKKPPAKSRVYEPPVKKPPAKSAPKDPKNTLGKTIPGAKKPPAEQQAQKAVPYKEFQKREESPNLGGRNLTARNKIVGTAKGGKAYGNATRDMRRAYYENDHPYARPPIESDPEDNNVGGYGDLEDVVGIPDWWPEGKEYFWDVPPLIDAIHQMSMATPKRKTRSTRGTA